MRNTESSRKTKRLMIRGKEGKKAVPRYESLRRSPLFYSLTGEELDSIHKQITIKRFRKNEKILEEEDTNDFMYIVMEGEAKVLQTTASGKDIILTLHQTGDFFGELSLIDGKTTPAAVYSTKDSIIALISKKDFFFIVFNQNKVLSNLLLLLCARYREALKRIRMLTFTNAAQRLKMLLQVLSETYGVETDEGTTLNIRLIHQDMADMAGLTRETVTRILQKWERDEEIRILGNRRIVLLPEFDSIQL